MKESRFKDNFWCSDIIGTNGYDIIIQHLNDGKKTCKEVEEFIRARASIEEKYGKDLLSLMKKACGVNELNTLKRALEVFKQQVENVAQCHIQLAQNLREEAKKLEDFREKQKEQRKKIEHLMESHHKQKTSLYKKTTDSKKTYEQKCRDKDEAEQLLNRNANVVNQKQYDKLLSKSSQTKATAEDADRTYQQNVTMLEKIMEEWQKEHINACEFFESQECDRIHLIRTAVWTHTNQLSQQCVTSDEMYEEIRKTLELCSVQKDIDYFVDLRKTSECPPAPLPYENFYNSQRNTAGRALNPGGGRRGPLPTPGSTPTDPVYSTVEDSNYSLVY
nr:PREDICTED: proline-serine-threonine phosphatase-interacting protein 2 isoform X2 [Latimeria chalumnae]|eukprot:XP_014350644.1 PREDICTED: proline-serine-threonine phosphatase-interacting protein 2 isoform X2 [Latimeria chalumnae]